MFCLDSFLSFTKIRLFSSGDRMAHNPVWNGKLKMAAIGTVIGDYKPDCSIVMKSRKDLVMKWTPIIGPPAGKIKIEELLPF